MRGIGTSTVNVLRVAAALTAGIALAFCVLAVLTIRNAELGFAPILLDTVPTLIEIDSLENDSFEAAAIAAQVIQDPDSPEMNAHVAGLKLYTASIVATSELLSQGRDADLEAVQLLAPLVQASVADLEKAATGYLEMNSSFKKLTAERIGELTLLKEQISIDQLTLLEGAVAIPPTEATLKDINRYAVLISDLSEINNALSRTEEAKTFLEAQRSEQFIKLGIEDFYLHMSRVSNPDVRKKYAIAARQSLVGFLGGDALVALKEELIQRDSLVSISAKVVQQLTTLKAATSKLAQLQRTRTVSVAEHMAGRLNFAKVVLSVGAAICVLAIVAVVFLTIEMRVARRLSILNAQMNALSSGDLGEKDKLRGQDELAELSYAVENLRTATIMQKKYETQLKVATERAERATKLKSDFLSMMSHEIRTPLNAIMGIFQLIEMAADNEKQKVRAQHGRGSAEGLFAMLSKVLDAARLEAGETEVTPEEISISALELHTADVLSGAVFNAKKPVEGRVNFDDSVPKIIKNDVSIVRQILANLIDNAVRFTDKGFVEVKAFGSKVNGTETLTLEVNDTGIGISDKDEAMVFDRFWQVDQSITRSAGGSGLGLPITKKLVDQIGGTIKFSSEIGVGTSFTVTIPCLRELEKEEV